MDWHTGGGFFESCSENVVKFLKNNNIVDASGIISETDAEGNSEFTSTYIIKESDIIKEYKADDIIELLKEKHNME